ncbi:pilus assembly protein FilA [Acinetobacter sp. LoGeW2-3]|uniref:putative pilus system protein FilA n=1 Tax=Acinetobacter sp. LoGeW2-3 TaxID=1808001 RepID=UPI000C059D00|nr:DUF6160 family protein [Acinetobacter sp. LoGeW2-3]ATO19624.1 pilus assembly protein FilA [Acinetobacter sp. LoGeW2-3]
MKKFTKLALISSMAISANAMAMQAMDDSALSATTGQDGLSIGIGISKIAIERLFIHDNDGLAAKGAAGDAGYGGTGNAGAIVIMGKKATATSEATTANWEAPSTDSHGIVIGANYEKDADTGEYLHLLGSRNLADLVIDSDAGTAANGGAFINIAAAVSGLDIQIGAIGVTASANSKAAYDAGLAGADSIRRGGGATVNKILSGLDIKTGQMNANIQVGSSPQGAMIKLDTIMTGGLEINNLGLLDNSSATKPIGQNPDTYAAITTGNPGELFIESIKLADAKSKDLTINQDINIYTTTKTGDVGTAGFIKIVSHGGPKDNYVAGIRIGGAEAASIGDVEVQGLQTYYTSQISPSGMTYTPGAVITIKGH